MIPLHSACRFFQPFLLGLLRFDLKEMKRQEHAVSVGEIQHVIHPQTKVHLELGHGREELGYVELAVRLVAQFPFFRPASHKQVEE